MVSRPWIVDSAPELRFTVPSAATPSKVTPVAGSYAGWPGGVRAEEPRGRDPGKPVDRPAAWPAISDCTRESTP